MRMKKGDTLIEVALAIGIFSLVAIVVVSVVSASTSSAQASLEVTITREEIDAQAEALRFIHDSYVNGTQSKVTTENDYQKLWKELTDKAVAHNDKYIQYNPATCSELYNNNGDGALKKGTNINGVGAKPFIINTRRLSNPSTPANIIITDTNLFLQAKTYPRILYSTNDNEDLLTQATSTLNTIRRVEGLFIVAVKGEDVTVTTGSGTGKKTAYYDFYIRSCWMPVNSNRASTISTAVRLYDPAIVH